LSAEDQLLLQTASFYIYLDDITIYCDREAVDAADRFVNMMESVLLQAGFELPASKQHNSDKEMQFKHLGLNWCFREGNLVLSCRKSIPSGLRFPDGSFNMKWTARLLLGIAGCGGTGVDPCRLHCEARLAGDLLRSIAGKGMKDADELLSIENGSADFNIISSCFTTLEEYSAQRCEHWCYGGSSLVCFVDASPVGYGWCIKVVNGTVTISDIISEPSKPNTEVWDLAEQAGIWLSTKAQRSWHINRKELAAIGKLMLYLHEMLCNHRTIGPPISSIFVYADSRTALRWMENRVGAKSIEKVAVQRLVCCINELVSDIRARGITVTYGKVEGALNPADRLSRLVEKWGLTASLGLDDVEPESLFYS
ncbi:hypothetical protein Pmar_PMAR013086, partial [Perkinsus marinus ATCC 50983]